MSASQTARVLTEDWAARQMFCPNCGNPKLSKFKANEPVADFFCDGCGDEFELKSQGRVFGRKVADGAYKTKMERLSENNSPNLILLHYDKLGHEVLNLEVVPRFFFTPSAIERRKPLSANAKRAGWVGSNILLDRIPKAGRVPVIHDRSIRNKASVVQDWSRLKFIDGKVGNARGWLLDVMKCVDDIAQAEFTLSDVYSFEPLLSDLYPLNRNVRPKIRQQLQVLRDNGYLEFVVRGRYRRVDRPD